MKTRFKLSLIIASIINASIMLLVVLFMLNQSVMMQDEKVLIRKTSSFKDKITKTDTASLSKFVFINVSKNKQLIPEIDPDFGDTIGNTVVTDRRKLTKLFRKLNKHTDLFKSVVCDILFEDKSHFDEALKYEMKRQPKLILPYITNNNSQEESTLFDFKKGLAEYVATNDVFVKFKLIYDDTTKTVPLVMYEQIHDTQITHNGWFYELDGRKIFHNFIINIRIKTSDILNNNTAYYQMSRFIELPDSLMQSLLKDKIIMISDFEDPKNDFHETVAGDMPGALILANTYLALEKGDNLVPMMLLPLLLISFFIISMLVFYPINIFEMWAEKITQKIPNIAAAKYLVGFISYVSLLSIVSVICFVLFNKHINVLYLTIYIYALEKVISFIQKKRAKKREEKRKEVKA